MQRLLHRYLPREGSQLLALQSFFPATFLKFIVVRADNLSSTARVTNGVQRCV